MEAKWFALMVFGGIASASMVGVARHWAEGQRTPAHICAEQTKMTPFCDGLLKDLAARVERENRK